MPRTKGLAWRHECFVCGAVYFASRCRIVCDSCFRKGKAKACGKCLLCGAKVPFFPDPHRSGNKGFLFCPACRRARHQESKRRSRQFHHVSRIVVPPVYENGETDGEPEIQ